MNSGVAVAERDDRGCPVYYHSCSQCEGHGKIACAECSGLGVLFRLGGFRRQKCPKCLGQKMMRCVACAGVGRFKISPLSEMLAGLVMEHSAAYYRGVVARLQPAINGLVDSVNYHHVEPLGGVSQILRIDGTSTVELNPMLTGADGFAGANNLQLRMRMLLRSDVPRLVRFIGRLKGVQLAATELGCHYVVQCCFLEFDADGAGDVAN